MTKQKILLDCRSVISDLLDKLWEFGGYTVGEKVFESYDVVKNAREQLGDIHKELNKLLKKKGGIER